MEDCLKTGCRKLETKCIECGRIVNSIYFPKVAEYWISVKDEMPIEGRRVLSYSPNDILQIRNDYIVAIMEYRHTWAHRLDEIIVTHWMPLPEPPKE
jgi:hypothetical protein